MESTKEIHHNMADEVSLKDLFLKFREWWKYLISKWIIIVLVGMAGASIGFLYASFQKAKYVGEIVFVLEEPKSGSLGGYASVASQLGIDLGGNSGSGVFSGDNIFGFLKSRLIVQKTLLSTTNVNGKEITFADFYLDFSGIKSQWKEAGIQEISFPAGTPASDFSLKQDSLLNFLYEKIKNDFSVLRPDKKLSFIAVKCLSGNEIFAKTFTERLVDEATKFYINTKTKHLKANIDKLQDRADSLLILLNRKTYTVAQSQDINQNPARKIATVGTEIEIRDKSIYQTMYAEVVRNLEVSRINMAQETPIIQIIDVPSLPLKIEKFGRAKGIVLGGIIAGLIIILILLAGKILKGIMTSK